MALITIKRTLRRSWIDRMKEHRMSVCSDRSCASSMMITLYLRVGATTGRYWESALSTIASRSSMPSVMNLMYVFALVQSSKRTQ